MSRTQWSSKRTPEALFWEKVDKTVGHGPKGDCWAWMAARRGNRTSGQNPDKFYGCFRFKSKAELAHRVAYLLTHGVIPEGKEILHTCDFPPCVNPDHLTPGSHTDNMRDCWAKGRGRLVSHPKGSQVWSAKLTESDVVKIRELAGKVSAKELARQFGIHVVNIRLVIRRKTWRHVGPSLAEMEEVAVGTTTPCGTQEK